MILRKEKTKKYPCIQISQLFLHFTSVSHFRFQLSIIKSFIYTPLPSPPSLPLDYIITLFKSKFQGESFFISRDPGYSFAAAALMGSTLGDRMSMLKSFGIIYALVCYLINNNLSQFCIFRWKGGSRISNLQNSEPIKNGYLRLLNYSYGLKLSRVQMVIGKAIFFGRHIDVFEWFIPASSIRTRIRRNSSSFLTSSYQGLDSTLRTNNPVSQEYTYIYGSGTLLTGTLMNSWQKKTFRLCH